MEYCYSGTESLWYGSWNRHVCRKGKCAADRHSRLTGVNPSRKQRCYSSSCLWSQAQRDKFDTDNSQSLGYWLTIRHQCICMWSWTEMLVFSFQLRAKTVWIPLPMSTGICRLGEVEWRKIRWYTITNLFVLKNAFVGMGKIKSIYKLRLISWNPRVKPNHTDSLTQLAQYMYKCHHPAQIIITAVSIW